MIGVDELSRLTPFAMKLIAELKTCQYRLQDVAFTLARRYLAVFRAPDVEEVIAALEDALHRGAPW